MRFIDEIGDVDQSVFFLVAFDAIHFGYGDVVDNHVGILILFDLRVSSAIICDILFELLVF